MPSTAFSEYASPPVEALLDTLKARQVYLWREERRLRLRAPKGALEPALLAQILRLKAEVLDLLERHEQCESADGNQDTPLTPQSISVLIGGPGNATPLLSPEAMARGLTVTFHPLPANCDPQITVFVDGLAELLKEQGVNVLSWDQAQVRRNTTERSSRFGKPRTLLSSSVDAVFNVEGSRALASHLRVAMAEWVYRLTAGRVTSSITRILHSLAWLDDDLLNRLEDPFKTQIVIIRPLDPRLTAPATSYREKIRIGLDVLFRSFAQIALNVAAQHVSLLNLNLCDTVYPRSELPAMVLNSLIPKLYVPIRPIPISRFEWGAFSPDASPYAARLIELSQRLAPGGLFPTGSAFSSIIRRRSRRDIFDQMADGRAGVSYGFVAWLEPPRFAEGDRVIDTQAWETLAPIEHLPSTHIRQAASGHWYVKLEIKGERACVQVPDLWLLSSRSGADKTALTPADVVRVGLSKGRFHLQQADHHPSGAPLRPSYDLYVMFAVAMAAALHAPALLERGGPLIHFHGYPAPDWFEQGEFCAGTLNPSMPCGTLESGVFNFLAMADIVQRHESSKLIAIAEPDHGVNIFATEPDYLIRRLEEGLARQQIELGGKFYPALRAQAENV
ncbi:TubC N-terminal docking domain-related protein [Pseudomonas huaxiensis]|uniref:TubC N-terminal docking domain-related protein n=1 Tax=Pseudomonas huaxiensis TaxID=2213017 RepID=UPI000DA65FCF|nr:hypothetical protein [Pseudomonas huaxiensis]